MSQPDRYRREPRRPTGTAGQRPGGIAQPTARPEKIVELDQPPSSGGLYRRAALRALPSPLGARRTADTLPDRTLVLRDVWVDRQRLTAYSRVCGFGLADTLPPSFPQVLGFPLAMALMSAGDFPLPMVGLVHVANRVEIIRPIGVEERLCLSAHAADLRPHHRGRQFDLVTTAAVGTEQVWRSVATYLRREGTPGPSADGTGGVPPLSPNPPGSTSVRTDRPVDRSGEPAPGRAPSGDTPGIPAHAGHIGVAPPDRPAALWHVASRVGGEYAAVSGDHNPIHTSWFGARLFGFPRPIAHGMWSKAHALAALLPRLPAAYVVDVRFKAPIALPSTVAFFASPAWSFAVRDPKSGKPYLVGTIR